MYTLMQYLLWWLMLVIPIGACCLVFWLVAIAVSKLTERQEKRRQRRKDELMDSYRIGLKTGWLIGYMDGRDDSNNECSHEIAEEVMEEKRPMTPLFIAQEMIDRGFYETTSRWLSAD